MKLDWKRAGCASIAECGKLTAIVYRSMDGEYFPSVVDENGRFVDECHVKKSMEAAEADAERWLEVQDRPEWHDVTDWLSWAEWHGYRIAVRPHALFPEKVQWQATSERDCGCMTGSGGLILIEAAKSAAEKWVREHGAQ